MVDQRVVYVCIALVAVWYFYPRDTTPTDFHELLKDVPAREDLTEHTKEFNKPEVIKVSYCTFIHIYEFLKGETAREEHSKKP